MSDNIAERIAILETERAALVERRSHRIRGGNAYSRLTKHIAGLDKRLGYLKKCQKKRRARDRQAAIDRLVNGKYKTENENRRG